ncbi:MAG: hypothetical protein RL238_2353 [Actinomycetota bacterium]|jgi:hypothetical protein
MRGRFTVATAATVLVLVLLAFAASANRSSPWTVPPSDGQAPVTQDTIAPENGAGGGGGGTNDQPATTSLSVIGIAITVFAGAFVLFGVWTIVRGMVMWGVPKFRFHRKRAMPELDPLEDDPLGIVPPPIETDTARLALHEGEPRNAIVACWMQLEAEASWAGLPRLDHETSTEYVQRVIAVASVDAAPITELGALFREARFSEHDIDESHRAAAIAALERVERALLSRIGTTS